MYIKECGWVGTDKGKFRYISISWCKHIISPGNTHKKLTVVTKRPRRQTLQSSGFLSFF